MKPSLMSTTAPEIKAPYVGPRSFQRGETFYGRDQEVFELTSRLLGNHVVLLHALSGAGKTSMINVGLITNLEKQGFRVLPVVHVDEQVDPKDMPTGATWNRYQVSTLRSLEKDRPKKERQPAHKLFNMQLEAYLKRRQPRGKLAAGRAEPRTLLIFDQFEEILNLNPADKKDKQDFFAWLMPVLYDTRYWVLFSMRDDFVGGLEPFLGYFPNRLTARYRLEFLSDQAAYQAIVMPAKDWGVTIQKEAADELVKELRKITVQDLEGDHEEQGPYIEPIQLQVVCLKLWQARRSDPNQITMEDVKKSGNVDWALSDFYNEVLNRIAGEDLRLQRNLRNWIERQLISPEGFRSQSMKRHLERHGVDQGSVDRLMGPGAYLVRQEQRLNATWYELAHDRLVRPILLANQRWRENNLQAWQLSAERWERDGKAADSEQLLKREALRVAQASYSPTRSTKIDEEYLQASQAAIDRARQVEIQRWADPERLLRVELGTNLEETGWGVIFHQDASPELKNALQELLDHRQAQAGAHRPVFFRIFEGPNGYRPGETAQEFLRRNGATSGLPNPEKVPYYLLLVGDPAAIPFDFQYGLDQQYAVGRIYFETLAEYQSYARSVRVCESGTVRLPNQAAVFSPQFPSDTATKLIAKQFTLPLLEGLGKAQSNWRIDAVTDSEANKSRLAELLGGPATPALILIASHAIWHEAGHPDQYAESGAVMCSDWPGSQAGPPQPQHYFAAADLAEQARLLGLVAFMMGNYTAGAPETSDFAFHNGKKKAAERSFLARLPQRLLGHPHGGALAVIGHVDQIWTTSFSSEQGASETGLYQTLLMRLMQGYTTGAAMELLNQRYTQVSDTLQKRLLTAFVDKKLDEPQIQMDWTRALDARNYILLGDPAARLPVDPKQGYQDPGPDWIRPEITAVIPATSQAVQSTSPPVEAPVELTGELWFANGLQVTSGTYDLPPLTGEQVVALVKSTDPQSDLSPSLRFRRAGKVSAF